MNGPPIKLALLQHAGPADVGAMEPNWPTIERMLREAAQRGADLAVTPELFQHRYFPQCEDDSNFDLAEPIPGPTTARLGQLAAELNLAINASLFERRAAGIYHNTAVMLDPRGQLIGQYRKMHVPDDPGFFEKFYFTPGDADADGDVVDTCRLDRLSVGMQVCWDQWFAEPARLKALQGAQLLSYPTAIGWHKSETADEAARQLDAWQTVQRAHAITNGLFVAAVNRIGTEGDLTFWGNSFVVDPGGQIIAQANQTHEQLLLAELDLAQIEIKRRAWPFLRDRRVEAYAGLTQRWLDD